VAGGLGQLGGRVLAASGSSSLTCKYLVEWIGACRLGQLVGGPTSRKVRPSATAGWAKIALRSMVRPALRPPLGRCAVIISLGAAPGRDESRDRASANRSPESFINGLVLTLKGMMLVR
jgi:hypothetical protein